MLQETATPGNIQELLAAGRDSNSSIPIHLHMHMHYGKPQGWEFANATQLQVRLARPYRVLNHGGIVAHPGQQLTAAT
jgi:hypothetical protein